jgi:hypothetical protein
VYTDCWYIIAAFIVSCNCFLLVFWACHVNQFVGAILPRVPAHKLWAVFSSNCWGHLRKNILTLIFRSLTGDQQLALRSPAWRSARWPLWLSSCLPEVGAAIWFFIYLKLSTNALSASLWTWSLCSAGKARWAMCSVSVADFFGDSPRFTYKLDSCFQWRVVCCGQVLLPKSVLNCPDSLLVCRSFGDSM